MSFFSTNSKTSRDEENKSSPLFISGPKRCSIDTYEYDDADTAAKYPLRDVSSSGFATSGPFASEWTSTSILPTAFSRLAAHSETVNPFPAAAEYRLFSATSAGTSAGVS